jgi:hypothetical protein
MPQRLKRAAIGLHKKKLRSAFKPKENLDIIDVIKPFLMPIKSSIPINKTRARSNQFI